MEGHYVSRKQWYLATALLLAGSLASFTLGQQLSHIRRQPVSHFVSHQAQAADVDGALGNQTTTTAPTVPAHHASTQPTSAPSQPAAPPAQGGGHKHGHDHADGHKHGHKGSGQKRLRKSLPQPSNSALPLASGTQKHGGR